MEIILDKWPLFTLLIRSCFNEFYFFKKKAIRAHGEAIQSMSWKCDGSLLVTTSKDKTMHVLDPRNANSNENLVNLIKVPSFSVPWGISGLNIAGSH